jgi:hypothetical protein
MSATPDIMAFVIQTLTNDTATSTAFGHTVTTPKYHADEIDPKALLPFLVYSEPTETPLRVFGGNSLCSGTFEIGVLDTSKLGARDKLNLVRTALNGVSLPHALAGGVLIYLRNDDNRSRPIGTTAPGSGVAEYGRAMVFNYKLTRTDT